MLPHLTTLKKDNSVKEQCYLVFVDYDFWDYSGVMVTLKKRLKNFTILYKIINKRPLLVQISISSQTLMIYSTLRAKCLIRWNQYFVTRSYRPKIS